MPAGAIIGAGVLGAGASVYGASKASSAANDAAAQNNALQREIYNKNVGFETPWMDRGNAAAEMYNNAIGLGKDPAAAANALAAYKGSTGFDTTLKTGVNALTQNAAVSGLLNSGANLKNITGYGQNLGQQYFQNWLGNLNTVSQQGLGATNALAGVGTNYANAVSQNNNNAANATGNAYGVGVNAFNNLLGQGTGAYLRYGSSYGGGNGTGSWDGEG